MSNDQTGKYRVELVPKHGVSKSKWGRVVTEVTVWYWYVFAPDGNHQIAHGPRDKLGYTLGTGCAEKEIALAEATAYVSYIKEKEAKRQAEQDGKEVHWL